MTTLDRYFYKEFMKKILVLVAVALLGASVVVADDAVPTPTSVPLKTLTCSNSKAKIEFGICGYIGCPATITVSGKATTYKFKRTKSNGALNYTTAAGKKPKCTVVISPLHNGVRQVNTASCAKTLVGAPCSIQ